MPLPQSLAEFNKKFTNRVTCPFAARLPGFGIVTHRGRKSGRSYSIPVNVFRRSGQWVFALTYGEGDWVKNVVHAGAADLHRAAAIFTSSGRASSAIRRAPQCLGRFAQSSA